RGAARLDRRCRRSGVRHLRPPGDPGSPSPDGAGAQVAPLPPGQQLRRRLAPARGRRARDGARASPSLVPAARPRSRHQRCAPARRARAHASSDPRDHMSEAPPPELFDKLVSLSKRRGFVFPSSEIYGGAGSTWDFGPLGAPRKFNLMFKTFVGPVEDEASVAWLRPETAQGIFVNFDNVQQSMRRKLPFGIAQVGKSFRNEITPGNFIFRSREFEQMEMQYFCRPADAPRLFDEWLATRRSWYDDLGMPDELLRFREHAENERAHYAAKAIDIEF